MLEEVKGVGPSITKKLRAVGITCAEALAIQDPSELNERTSIGEGQLIRNINSARELLGWDKILSGLELEEHDSKRNILSTGVETIDQNLFGGIETGNLVQIYGKSCSGKTILCHQLAVMATQPYERGGLEGDVLWVDTCNSVKPKKLRTIAMRFDLEPEDVLRKVKVWRRPNRRDFEHPIEVIPRLFAEENVKLVIIDCLSWYFGFELVPMIEMESVRRRLFRFMNELRTLTMLGCTFVFTNGVHWKPGLFTMPAAPLGGHVLAQASDYIFLMKSRMQDQKVLELRHHNFFPKFEIQLQLGWGGFYGSKSQKERIESNLIDYAQEIYGNENE
jgi:DNA repair protein RadA